ncbi:hypothetical protein NM208_g4874 [Fusarium decemcellulare]|uniref:Uncharacterized protein n=1 Tax=Fusarium decemcellulare TaxID=57161 RepID=A0ACC1SIY6_9HYPO|nr:hypothetical protein NM208_g4874 [Fusarium decemcellulare]
MEDLDYEADEGSNLWGTIRSTFKHFSISDHARAHVGPIFTYHTHLHTSAAKDSTDIRFGVLPVAVSIAKFVEFTQGLFSRTHPIRLTESTLDSTTGELDVLERQLADSRAIIEDLRSETLTELGKECKELCKKVKRALADLESGQYGGSLDKALQDSQGQGWIQKLWKGLAEIQRRLSRLITIHICYHLDRHITVLDKIQREARDLGMIEPAEPRRLLEEIATVYVGADSTLQIGNLQPSLKALLSTLDHGASVSPKLRSDDFKNLSETLERLDQATALAISNHAFLKSLHFSKFDARWEEIPTAHVKTFGWVFRDDARGGNMSKPIGFTDCAGLDKTNACLRAWAGDGNRLLMPKYFFWVAGTRLQKSKVGLLRSLLFEILRALPELIPSVSDSVGGTPDDAMSDDEKWRLADLENALLYVVERCKGHNRLTTQFCFFIDGLDELEESRGQDETHIDLVGTLMAMSELPGVKLCVSSRPWDVFCQGLQDASGTLRLEDLTRDDMRNYTKAQLDTETSFRNFYTKSHEYRQFIDEVVVKANGVFLWVRLVTRDLLKQGFPHSDTVGVLHQRLDRFPKDLDEFFINTMRRIDKDSLPQAARIFWMAAEVEEPQLLMAYSLLDELPFRMDCSHHNLENMSDSEVRMRRDRMRRRLDECSRGLLEIVEDEPTMDLFFRLKVDYIHRTVRDFLKQPSTAALLPLDQRFAGLDGYGWLAPCVALVQVIRRAPFSKHQPQAIIRLLKDFFFFARQAEENQVDRNDLLKVLLAAEKAYMAAKKEFELPTDTNLALGLACQAKVFTFVKSKPARDLRSPRELKERSPLSYALEISATSRSWQIHPEIVSLLLEKGADPDRWNKNCYDNISGPPQRGRHHHQRPQFSYPSRISTIPIEHDNNVTKAYEARSPWEEFITSVYRNPSLANDMRIIQVMRSFLGHGADMCSFIQSGSTTLTVKDAIKELSTRQGVDLDLQPGSGKEAVTTALEGKRVVVIGAGVAGLAFIIGLRRQWPTDRVPPRIAIYDRRKAEQPCQTEQPDRSVLLTGPAAASGRETLQSLGLLEEALQYSVPEEADDDYFGDDPLSIDELLEESSSAGSTIVAEQAVQGHGRSRSGLPRRMRYGDLCKILVKAANQTDEIFWGVTCQNVLTRPDGKLGIWLTTEGDEDGRLDACDYVIAADGASSTIRASILSRNSPMMAENQVGGVATFPGRVPSSLNTWGTRTAKDWVNRTPFCSYYTVDENHVIWDVNSFQQIAGSDDLDNLDESKRVLELCGEHTNWMSTTDGKRQKLRTLFNNTHPRSIFSFRDGHKGVYSGSWDKNVVFIGDSNHAVGLSTGDGGSLALRDGWDLAEKFTRSEDLHGAIEVYKDASTIRASRELNFWGQGALNNGFRGVVSVSSVIRMVGNLFLMFLKGD